MPNTLYYGDNLDVLRKEIKDETVDLVYLDPPFNSNASYNVLFKAHSGKGSQAQIEAFEDTWDWGPHAEAAIEDVIKSGNPDAANLITAMRKFLGDNAIMAYLAMMAVRLIELHRVLKDTGSLYLHCDPTASHYLKLVLDSIFGIENYRNEIIWKRKAGRGETNKEAIRFGVSSDTILFYAKSKKAVFHRQLTKSNPDYIASKFVHQDPDGRRYRLDNITSPSFRPNLVYEYKGIKPPPKGWAVSPERMKQMDDEGLLHIPSDPTMRIQRKRYLDKLEGETVDSLWTDIPPINSQAQERLGYPTQKPLALLERILKASSNEGDIVLDPFCGCGTTIHAAQKLDRQWIGIDITHLAIGLIESRLKAAFPGIKFTVEGTPKDFEAAVDLATRDKFQFQWWAVTLVNAVPYGGKKKGADSGIDGYYYCKPDGKQTEAGIVSVKGGDHPGVKDVRDLVGVVQREKAPVGVLITLRDPTGPMKSEAAKAGSFDCAWGKFQKVQIVTVKELLDGKNLKLPPQEAGGGLKVAQKEDTSSKKQKQLL